MQRSRFAREIGLTLSAVFACSSAATAQNAPPARADTAASSRPLFSARDAIIAGGFAGLTVAMFPLDQHIAHQLENPGTQANHFLHHAATGFELIASPGAYVIGGSLYAVGRLGRFGRVADLGLHGTAAVLVGDAVSGALKGLAGRARPFVTADTNAADFKFGKGFTNADRTSFPSGHTTTAFAAAAAVTAETGRWWPRSTLVVGPLMFGGASMVGLSRMYHNKHWASDVVLGAAIGTFSGQKTVQFLHSRPGYWLDRILLSTTITPVTDGGFAIGWSAPTP
jgi:membrane-associated phospholipid phosphatase